MNKKSHFLKFVIVCLFVTHTRSGTNALKLIILQYNILHKTNSELNIAIKTLKLYLKQVMLFEKKINRK